MKQVNIIKALLILVLLGTVGTVAAQVIHPNAFGAIYTGGFPSNWYKDYVNVKVAVISPSAIAGEKAADAAEVGTGTSQWPGIVYTPIYNQPIVMPASTDSNGCSPFPIGSMTGKIAVIWRGPIGSPCSFTEKAYNAQNAGAIACVIINEYAGAAPFVPGYTAGVGTVTIPVVMISNLDGIAIAAQYALGPVNMTISPWGYGLGSDLGFVPQGASRWQNYATPRNQIISSGNPLPYQGVDGAFIANYGTHDITHAKLTTGVTFTPTGGSTSTIHTDTISTALFTVADSILAMYPPAYDISGITANGVVTVNYSISSDSVDNFPGNNSVSQSFYLTDSLYSKGVYDFTNNRPSASLYEAAGLQSGDNSYIWGNMYYVNKAGSAASRVQWSMSAATDTSGPISAISDIYVYLFKWVEGMNGERVDSFVENGELELVGLGIKSFTGRPADTSGGYFEVSMLDSSGGGIQPLLDASSWYYVATEIPTGYFLGCDGISNTYPRIFGRWENNIVEYGSPVWPADRYTDADAQVNTFGSLMSPAPFGGTYKVDSMIFSSQKGLVPGVAMIVNNTPITDTTHTGGGAGVKAVQSFAKFNVYPNPTSDNINVAITLDNSANVTYTILDGHARKISTETHNSVTSETYTYNTNNLASGNYYIIVHAGSKEMFRKFTVIKK